MKKVYVATQDGVPIAVANNLVRLGVELGFHPRHFTRIKLPYTTRKGVLITAMPLLTSKRNTTGISLKINTSKMSNIFNSE